MQIPHSTRDPSVSHQPLKWWQWCIYQWAARWLAALLCVQVLLVDPEKRAIVVKGSVPGKPGNVVEIAPAKCGGTAI